MPKEISSAYRIANAKKHLEGLESLLVEYERLVATVESTDPNLPSLTIRPPDKKPLAETIREIIEFFEANKTDPGGWWAPSEDRSSLGLQYDGPTNESLWLDLNANGEIHLLWRCKGQTSTYILREKR